MLFFLFLVFLAICTILWGVYLKHPIIRQLPDWSELKGIVEGLAAGFSALALALGVAVFALHLLLISDSSIQNKMDECQIRILLILSVLEECDAEAENEQELLVELLTQLVILDQLEEQKLDSHTVDQIRLLLYFDN